MSTENTSGQRADSINESEQAQGQRTVFNPPVDKNHKEKRKKIVKERLHIYLSESTINKVDERATEFGLSRSNFIAMLINYGLNKVMA